ncbi:two-component sensor histidine kinase [Limnobacter sp. MED105]|uniref:sensor histidine kinase n=1 Tax=Limnobacter sp. MED105 TaxID=391597 RepID=UPI000156CCAD|nr:two-component sensor histidine kinase [Limnobacter sp. MED105]EDM83264.1 putative sensor histidine kinase [Limnobacter sp. MED105]
MFGITGLLFPAFVLPAAIYSGRELALSENLFFSMSVANQLGSKMFGSAFVGIFMMHPVRLVNVRWLYGLFVLMFCWWIVNAGRLVSSMDIGLRAAIVLLLLLSFWFGFQQWRKTKGKPLQRASLRWLALSLLLGASLYIFLFTASAGLGWITAIPQGYAFGFFLMIYIGIALGIGRYRLFDLDVWAYRLLLWIAATLAVVLLDTALIFLLDWSQGLALGVSLWICGVLYFPIRQWLWQKLVSRKAPELPTLLPELLLIAFSGTAEQRAKQWQRLLRTIYTPLQIRQSSSTAKKAELFESGLALLVPSCAGMPAFELIHRGQGKQLFSTMDTQFVNALAELMGQADAARASKEQGAIEERKRITRDIHDDVGARLLMLIHSSENPKQAELARSAMEDLRTALSNIDGLPIRLEDAVADWRDEANQRCDAAKIQLHWENKLESSSQWLQPRLKTLLQRAFRECMTNAIKHGKPSTISTTIQMLNDRLIILVTHNGERSDPTQWTPGIGTKGLLDRLATCDGILDARLTPSGETEVRIQARICP